MRNGLLISTLMLKWPFADYFRCRYSSPSTRLSLSLSPIPAVGCSKCFDADFVLCIARALPAFLLTLVDTGIFYTVRIKIQAMHPKMLPLDPTCKRLPHPSAQRSIVLALNAA